MTPVEILTEAKRLIEERGWGRFYFVDDAGCLCLSGALRLAGGATLEIDESDPVPLAINYDAWVTARERVTHLLDQSIVSWNDHPARMKDEVIAVLDRAIATLA